MLLARNCPIRLSRRSGKKPRSSTRWCIIHPNGFTAAAALGRFYFNNVIGNPLDTTLALHYLIFDGVFERHPKLKVFAVHGGGYLGAYSGRIDHAWGARSDAHGNLPKPPTELSASRSLFRHGRFHAAPARSAGEYLRRRSRRHGHGLSVRHARNTTRSATSIRSTASTQRPAPRSAAATRRSCWGSSPPIYA